MKPKTEAKLATASSFMFLGGGVVMALGGFWKPLFFIGIGLCLLVAVIIGAIVYYEVKHR